MERWLIKYFPIQRQDAWSTEKGLKFMHYQDPATGKLVKYSPYEMEMEAEAFGMNGSFVAEKAQKGGSPYLRKPDWIDRAELNSRFKWYKETLAKSKDDERKLMGWRDDIDPDGNVHKVVKASVLEAMGTGGGE